MAAGGAGLSQVKMSWDIRNVLGRAPDEARETATSTRSLLSIPFCVFEKAGNKQGDLLKMLR